MTAVQVVEPARARHTVIVDGGAELIDWCESNASRGDFVFLTALQAPLEGYGITVIDDRRWWGAMLRELHHHNQSSAGVVFLVVDFELIFRDERGGDSVDELLGALRQLTQAPAPAAVRVLLIGGSRADAARALLVGAAS